MKKPRSQAEGLDVYSMCKLDLTVKEYEQVTVLIESNKVKAISVQGICLVRDSRGKRRERPEFAMRGTLAVEGQQLLRLLRSPHPDELPTLEEVRQLTPRQFDARYRQSVQAAQAAATPPQASAQAAAQTVQLIKTLPEQEQETGMPRLLDLEQGA